MACMSYQRKCQDLKGGLGGAAEEELPNDLQMHWGCFCPEGKEGPVEQVKVEPGESGVPGVRSRVFEEPPVKGCVKGVCASRECFDEEPMLTSDTGISYANELDHQLHGGKSVSRVTFNYRAMHAI